MPFLSTPLTLSATTSIVSSAWISGSISALSICAIPAILHSQPPSPPSGVSLYLARAWHAHFRRALYIPATAVAAACNYLYLAHRHRASGAEWRGYAAAAAANLMLVPFTLVFIAGINGALIAAASSSGADGKGGGKLSYEAARSLIERWGNYNACRVFMPLAGAGLGLWNLLC
ncbi:hypothetical protein F5Y17DRAFT_421036 [Xylariaceae sp. FL0594]|nr:hypothetical protein F5Y17DRAFT_421036 [Xylariaceae sp. FL0594]